ncbi:hypothetical protein [Pontibacter sp. G13]|uniref:hypothetical protein n=1 Tax=Pontibacter sp. G13 TaxID=3074898 RepID=UPI002889C5FC|nr:hypothetical protein [Pontibacter sp. G13]WNJ21564.1 hypothetical protein RJD25_28720 [Pontibacter sp. G13]
MTQMEGIAQAIIRFPIQVPVSLQEQDIFRIQILSPGTGNRLYLYATLSDPEGELRCEWTSPVFQGGGNLDFRNTGLPLTSDREGLDSLDNGIYRLCIRLIDRENDEILGSNCRNVHWYRLKAFARIQESIDQDLPEHFMKFSLGGSFRVTGQYSTLPEPIGQQLGLQPTPNRYLRLEAAPKVTLAGVPLSAQFFYTTESRALRYDLNRIRLNLDRAAIMTILRKKAEHRIKAEESRILSELSAGQRTNGLHGNHSNAQEWYSKMLDMRAHENEDRLRKASRISSQLGYSDLNEFRNDSSIQDKLVQYRQLRGIKSLRSSDSYRTMQDSCAKVRNYLTTLDSLPDDTRSMVLDSLDRICRHCAQMDTMEARYQRLEKLEQEIKPYQDVTARLAEYDSINNSSLTEIVSDPKVLATLPVLSRGERMLASIKKLGVGTVYPSISANTLDGIGLTGIDIELNPGNWYFSIAGGEMMTLAMFPDTGTINQPTPKIGAIRVGYGALDEFHVHAIGLYANHRPFPWQESTEIGAGPVNIVSGLEIGGSFWDGRVHISANGMRSLTSNLENGDPVYEFPEYYRGIPPRLTGLSWGIKGGISPLPGTRILGNFTFSDVGYVSLGAPFLIQRNQKAIQVHQQFLSGKLSISAYYRDQLSPFNIPGTFERTVARSAGGQLGIQLPKGTSISLNYAPYFISSPQADSIGVHESGTSLISGNISTPWRIGMLIASSSMSLTRQVPGYGDTTGFTTQMTGLSQTVSLGPVSIQANGTWMQVIREGKQQDIRDIQVSLQGVLPNRWSFTGGWRYRDDMVRQSRDGIWVTAQLPIGNRIDWELTGRYQIHQPNSPDMGWNRTPEWVVRTSLGITL